MGQVFVTDFAEEMFLLKILKLYNWVPIIIYSRWQAEDNISLYYSIAFKKDKIINVLPLNTYLGWLETVNCSDRCPHS